MANKGVHLAVGRVDLNRRFDHQVGSSA
jgi:hypothetical protein